MAPGPSGHTDLPKGLRLSPAGDTCQRDSTFMSALVFSFSLWSAHAGCNSLIGEEGRYDLKV